MPTARGVDLDETDAQVREAEAALVRAMEEPLTMPAVLLLVGSLQWEEVLPSQSSRGGGGQKFRIF